MEEGTQFIPLQRDLRVSLSHDQRHCPRTSAVPGRYQHRTQLYCSLQIGCYYMIDYMGKGKEWKLATLGPKFHPG